MSVITNHFTKDIFYYVYQSAYIFDCFFLFNFFVLHHHILYSSYNIIYIFLRNSQEIDRKPDIVKQNVCSFV